MTPEPACEACEDVPKATYPILTVDDIQHPKNPELLLRAINYAGRIRDTHHAEIARLTAERDRLRAWILLERSILIRGALLGNDREYEDWQEAVATWVRRKPTVQLEEDERGKARAEALVAPETRDERDRLLVERDALSKEREELLEALKEFVRRNDPAMLPYEDVYGHRARLNRTCRCGDGCGRNGHTDGCSGPYTEEYEQWDGELMTKAKGLIARAEGKA